MTPLWALTVAEAGRRIAAGTLSPVDLVESFLARIASVDRQLGTFIHVDKDGARRAARTAEAEIAAGRLRGPLHGLPFGVKDNYDAAGLPATANCRLRLDRVAETDATLVRRLKAAGAILLGKLNTWEYGTGNGGEYYDTPFATPRNPWDLSRFVGGSSTGAGAGVAAGTAMFALGSDTTGSVRLPAAATGVIGLKPTPGRLSRHGILPNCYSLDIAGTFTWTVEDTAILLGAIAGEDAQDPVTEPIPVPDYRRTLDRGIEGLRIAVIRDVGPGFPLPDADLLDAFDRGCAVLESLGATLHRVTLPVPAAECFAVTRIIGPAESAAIHEAEYRENPAALGYALRDKLHAGMLTRAVDYVAAQRRRREIAARIDALLRGFDAAVTFGSHHVAPRLGVEPEMTAFTVETTLTPFNLSAHPSLVQCTGFDDGGLPLHWQIAGNRFDEASILRVAAAYERATPWRARRPSLQEGDPS